MANMGKLRILLKVSLTFSILLHVVSSSKESFARGNKRRKASYLTNPDLVESSCFDGEEYADILKDAREKCDIPICSRDSTDERCLNRESPEWMRSCGVVQRLFKGCDYSSTPLKKVAQNRQSVCRTTGGTDCRIPWVFKGRVYRGCSTVEHSGFWCHDNRGDNPASHWGLCNSNCPQDDAGVALDEFCHTTVDQPCKFPFTYKGKEYNGCTNVDIGSYWCEDNLGRTLSNALCDNLDSVCQKHVDGATLPPPVIDDLGIVPKDKYCFLRRMRWISEQKVFQPYEVLKSIYKIKDNVVKECLMYAWEECKKSENQEFTVDGVLADIGHSGQLACIDNRFTRFCNRRLETLLQSMSKS